MSAQAALDLKVYYVYPHESGRSWSSPQFQHQAGFLTGAKADLEEALAATNGCDLLVMAYYADPVSHALMTRRARSGSPWAFWGEKPGVHLQGLPGRLLRRWRLRVLRASSAPIWGIGSWAVDAYRREMGDRRHYRNLPYFSDLDRFRPSAAEAALSTAVRFCFVGAISRRKGVDLILTAFRQLIEKHPNAGHHLTITGEGPEGEFLRSQAIPLKGQVTFKGFADWPELPAAYSGHDCLIVPSRYDGWGMVVPEGLASGLPVIATTAMGAAIDLINHGSNGWRVPAGEVAALSEAMTEAANQIPNDRNGWRSRALASVGRHQLSAGVHQFSEAILEALRPTAP